MFCDQADEDIQHVLVGCVFAREFWYKILASVGLQTCAPNQVMRCLRTGGEEQGNALTR
jgi:hypothetical protein